MDMYRDGWADPYSMSHTCGFAALIILLATIALPIGALAARFDENMGAPRELSVPEFEGKVREYFRDFQNGRATMSDVLRDSASYANWVDIRWHLARAIDTRQPLNNLAEFGISQNDDESYTVDLDRFPQWFPLDMRIASFLHPQGLDWSIQVLKSRGFRESDIATLKIYLQKHKYPRRVSIAENRELVESFAVKIGNRTGPGPRIERSEIMAFMYQSNRNREEASRKWAMGVLSSLDRRRQTILESVLMEEKRAMVIAPDDIEDELRTLVDAFISGEAVRAIHSEQWEILE